MLTWNYCSSIKDLWKTFLRTSRSLTCLISFSSSILRNSLYKGVLDVGLFVGIWKLNENITLMDEDKTSSTSKGTALLLFMIRVRSQELCRTKTKKELVFIKNPTNTWTNWSFKCHFRYFTQKLNVKCHAMCSTLRWRTCSDINKSISAHLMQEIN